MGKPVFLVVADQPSLDSLPTRNPFLEFIISKPEVNAQSRMRVLFVTEDLEFSPAAVFTDFYYDELTRAFLGIMGVTDEGPLCLAKYLVSAVLSGNFQTSSARHILGSFLSSRRQKEKPSEPNFVEWHFQVNDSEANRVVKFCGATEAGANQADVTMVQESLTIDQQISLILAHAFQLAAFSPYPMEENPLSANAVDAIFAGTFAAGQVDIEVQAHDTLTPKSALSRTMDYLASGFKHEVNCLDLRAQNLISAVRSSIDSFDLIIIWRGRDHLNLISSLRSEFGNMFQVAISHDIKQPAINLIQSAQAAIRLGQGAENSIVLQYTTVLYLWTQLKRNLGKRSENEAFSWTCTFEEPILDSFRTQVLVDQTDPDKAFSKWISQLSQQAFQSTT